MQQRLPAERLVFPDSAALAIGAAERIAAELAGALAARGSASLVLAGGSTPERTYRRLAEKPLDWSRIDVYWGDERCVDVLSRESNFRMARQALIDPARVPPDRLHRIAGERGAGAAARAYEDLLRARFEGPWPDFDVVIAGVGRDGHVASLFPDAGAADLTGAEEHRWVIHVRRPAPSLDRVSLRLAALASARYVCFLVSGAAKAQIIGRLLTSCPTDLPASRLSALAPRVAWFLDRSAAAEISG